MARSFISNLVGFSTASDLVKLGQGYTQNMYAETLDSTEHAVNRILRPFPGYTAVDSVEGSPRGLFRVSRGYDGKPKVYGVWGEWLYILADGALKKIGQSNYGSDAVHFAETGGEGSAHPHLVLADGKGVFAVDTTLTAAEQRADFRQVSIPVRAGDESKTTLISPSHIAYAYGYLVVNDKGTDAIYYSYQYPFETTKDDSTIDYDIFRCAPDGDYPYYGWVEYSEWQPDNTLALIGNGSRFFTFGERSYQVFTYNSTGETPFTSPDTAAKLIGIKNANSLACLGDRCVWLGSSEMGDGQVFCVTSDNELTCISTPEIERRIAKCDSSVCNAFMFQFGQHQFYVLDFGLDRMTIAYDFREGGWIDLASTDSAGRRLSYRYAYPAMGDDGRTYMQSDDSLVYVDGTKWTEHDGRSIVRTRRGGVVQVDHHPFFVDAIKLLTNNGEYGLLEGSECTVSLRYSGDGVTFNDEETTSVGAVGNYDYDCAWYNLGMASYLTVEVSCSDNVPFAIYGMTISARAMR